MKRSVPSGRYTKFLLYLVVVVLVNIAGMTLFFRGDLTANRIYSLSEPSREVVSTLSEPLTVKAFFTDNLPPPYNNIERYLNDLLQEYAIAGNRYFNFQFYNVSSEDDATARENQEVAAGYGISPVQIQKFEQDEVKFQMAYMGLALIHGDVIETIPTITATDGLEFEITAAIRKMNNKISALLSLEDDIAVKLFLSSSLQAVGPYMNLAGLPELSGKVRALVDELNRKTFGRLRFESLDPTRSTEAAEAARGYGVLALEWNEFSDRQGRTIPADKGYAGIIVEHGGKAEALPLISVMRLPIFGTQYQLADVESLQDAINETVENLININEEIGYLADHGTRPLRGGGGMPGQPQGEGLSRFEGLLSESYSVREVFLKEAGVPEGLPTLIIARPTEPFSEYALYQIDQYLMKGRNLAIFLDRFQEAMPTQQSRMMGQSQYRPIDSGLEKLLAHYGLDVKAAFVLDENSFRQDVPRAFGGGERPLYFAPIIKNEFINKDVPFLQNVKGLVMLKASPVTANEQTIAANGLQAVNLFSSSPRSWEMSGQVDLNPMFIQPPRNDGAFQQQALAYLVEGSFPSYFSDQPVPEKEVPEPADPPGDPLDESDPASGVDMSQIESGPVTIPRGRPGKIFLIGTSEILRDNILDAEGRSPNAQFVMNVIDALNGREAYAVMRSKAQRFNPLQETEPATRTTIKAVNIAGLPVLVVLCGLLVWYRRSARKRVIQEMFNH